MKTTIQKNVILTYLSLGALLILLVNLNYWLQTPSETPFGNLDESITQLLLEVYALFGFGFFVLISSLAGWWWAWKNGKSSYQMTFQLCLVFGILYFAIFGFLGV